MKRYDSYKDSGVQWIGEIPEGWELKKLKYQVSCNDSVHSENTKEDLVINYVEIGDVNSVDGIVNSTEYAFKDAPSRARRITLPGDVIVSTVRTYLKAIAPINTEGLTVSTGFAVLRPKTINPNFLAYSCLNEYFINEVISKSVGVSYPAINASQIVDIKIVCPPYNEQTAIANYLDNKCSKIDKVIAAQEKRVELLRELKQSIITRAVTRGIPSTGSGQAHAKMKDSGVDSIGIIPTTWEVCKTLYVLSQPITDGPHETPQLFDEGIPFVSAEAVSCGNGKIDFDHIRGYISESYYKECCKKYIPQKGDVYMIKSGATTGKVSIVDTDRIFTIWSPLAAFRCNKDKMLPYFLFFALQCPFYQRQVELGWNYGTQQNIGMRTLEKLFLPVPPIEEQAVIIKYIEQQTSRLDSSIAKALRQIELLKEYKQSLITEVVTGKRKVI